MVVQEDENHQPWNDASPLLYGSTRITDQPWNDATSA